MISRPILHVTGRPSSGKTAFIEALLRGRFESLLCVRGTEEPKLREVVEAAPAAHPELSRYRKAGATDAVCFRFSRRYTDTDDFFMTEFMSGYSDAVVIEGDSVLRYHDLTVFVAPPPDGVTLLSHGPHSSRNPKAASRAALWQILQEPEAFLKMFSKLLGDPSLPTILTDPVRIEELRQRALADLGNAPPSSPTRPVERWRLAPGYEGIVHAGMVVVNVRTAAERERGKRMLDEIPRMRKDEAIFRDLFDYRGSRVPITAVMADLSDPKDTGWRKALARVMRTLRAER
jgi:molybdopterin-guanine dinucleotide biosynthesis protein